MSRRAHSFCVYVCVCAIFDCEDVVSNGWKPYACAATSGLDAEASIHEVLTAVMKTMEDENEADIDAIRQTYPSLNSLEDIIPTMMAIGVARRIE